MGNSVIYRPAYDAEVEYLESDGNSYIDTGLKASSELGILAHIYVTGIFPFGGRNGLNNKEFSFCALQNGDSGFRFGSSVAIAQGGRLNELYEFDNTQNHNILKVGNTTYVATYNSFISDYNVFLFGLNNAGAAENISSRIYDFKIYQNSTLVRDFISVRIGSVGYMYDKVTKQLFANKGTGNFVLGNDVSNAVIPQQRCVLYFGNQRSVGFERIYEEYEWLISNSDSNGTPYINTLIIPNVGQEISFTFKVLDATTNGNEAGVYNATDSSWSLRVIRCYKNTANNYMILEYNNNNNDYPNHTTMVVYDEFATNKEYECSLTINSATSALGVINNNSKTLVPNSDVTLGSDSHKIFVNGTTNPKWSFKSVGFKKFKISGIIDLTPCKLLQSIPAILDGNGIARQAGECGMWDKVSNKFYGNVASSGTFTVKGPKCYEEYKWLCGDGSAYIDTSLKLYETDVIEIKTKHTSIPERTNETYYLIYGNNSGSWNGVTYVLFYSSTAEIRPTKTQSSNAKVLNGDINVAHTLIQSSTKIVFDGEVVWQGESSFIELNNHCLLYSVGSDTAIQHRYKGNVAYFRIVNKLNLVPCKLTHGIPASMDANGISRPAGTCGMWDKVNDKFYGNVASSGTFTVSND